MVQKSFLPAPPQSDELTGYDEEHLVTYLRIMDAVDEGADWKEIAQVIFGADSMMDEASAKRQFQSHLARAKWISTSGYSHLLNKK